MSRPIPFRKTALRGLAVLALSLAAGAAAAQPPPANASGWRLVRKYCSNCHEVRPHPAGRRSGADGAPNFAALAADPVKGTADHLRSVLGGPHSSMPPHQFSEEEVDGVIQYFQDLRDANQARKRS